jgi:hypothetical protein
VTSLDHLEQARQLLADYTTTVAVLRRAGHDERSAVEGAGLLLADRLTEEAMHN